MNYYENHIILDILGTQNLALNLASREESARALILWFFLVVSLLFCFLSEPLDFYSPSSPFPPFSHSFRPHSGRKENGRIGRVEGPTKKQWRLRRREKREKEGGPDRLTTSQISTKPMLPVIQRMRWTWFNI